MLIPAILVSIVALLAAMDEQLFGASMMARPLFTGPIIGLIMGDLQTGVIIGATLESMFMGSIMVGSAVPPEVYASSILSIAIAIQTGAGAGTAVALALLIKIMSNNKILPYLFLGFVAVMYLGMDVIGVAVVGLCIAFLAVNNMQFEEEDDF